MEGGATVASIAQATRGAQVVVLATPWDAARQALQSAEDLQAGS